MTDQDRLREVTFRSVDALRQVVVDLEITEDELHAAGDYFNRLGRAGLFRSLLDIGFAMTVMDRVRGSAPGTRPNLEGPEYRSGAPARPGGSLIERSPGDHAQLLTLTGRVIDAVTGEPVHGAEIDLWHADEDGGYDRVGHHLRGRVSTGSDGQYTVETLLPKDYAEHEGDPIGELLEQMGRHRFRAAHIHLKVRIAGEVRLTTQVFLADSPYLETDYVIGAVSDDLVIAPVPAAGSDDRKHLHAVFDIAVPVPARAGVDR